jgi:hypothetical protein
MPVVLGERLRDSWRLTEEMLPICKIKSSRISQAAVDDDKGAQWRAGVQKESDGNDRADVIEAKNVCVHEGTALLVLVPGPRVDAYFY